MCLYYEIREKSFTNHIHLNIVCSSNSVLLEILRNLNETVLTQDYQFSFSFQCDLHHNRQPPTARKVKSEKPRSRFLFPPLQLHCFGWVSRNHVMRRLLYLKRSPAPSPSLLSHYTATTNNGWVGLISFSTATTTTIWVIFVIEFLSVFRFCNSGNWCRRSKSWESESVLQLC